MDQGSEIYGHFPLCNYFGGDTESPIFFYLMKKLSNGVQSCIVHHQPMMEEFKDLNSRFSIVNSEHKAQFNIVFLFYKLRLHYSA